MLVPPKFLHSSSLLVELEKRAKREVPLLQNEHKDDSLSPQSQKRLRRMTNARDLVGFDMS